MKLSKWNLPPDGAAAIVVRLLSEQGRVYWKRYLTAFGMMVVVAATSAVSVYLLGKVVNEAYVARNFPGIVLLSGVMVVLFALKGSANYAQAVILSRISNAILADNQKRLFARLMHENLGYLSSRHSSEFMARLVAGAGSVAAILNLLVTSVGRDFLTLIGLIFVMIYQDPWMSLFGLLIGPPAVFGVRKLIGRVRDLVHKQYANNASIMETMQEALQGIRTVKAFSLEETMRLRVEASASDLERHSNKVARISNRASPLMETLGGCAIAASLLYGGYSVIKLGSTPGQFFSFLTAFMLAYEPAKRLARLGIDLNASMVGAKMLLEIIESPASEPDDSAKPDLRLTTMHIEFRDVEFSYRPGEIVLNRLSFTAEPGKVTALVGPSGGGKSTIMAMLLRFYEPDQGAILIDGQKLSDCNRQSVRHQSAYVGQDVFLFKGTIRENIAFGKIGTTHEEIIAAARAAFAHDFIMGFPLQYDTPVGEHGAQLSGGQRQRVAIARALIRNAPIVLLDEATASLDSESERQVQHAIEQLCQGRTTIAIAHRLHTIRHADKILVIEDGKVVEAGRHDDLLQRKGRYSSFVRLLQREEDVLAIAAPVELITPKAQVSRLS
jgi:ATP-binding cassette, subfamily B, bacterial MsbA